MATLFSYTNAFVTQVNCLCWNILWFTDAYNQNIFLYFLKSQLTPMLLSFVGIVLIPTNCLNRKRFRNKEGTVLCVSCPSANEFSAILFLLFARSSSNSPWSFQRFRRTLRRNFNWIRQMMKNFPYRPPL